MSKGGRPTDYNEDIADVICQLVASGQSVLSISKLDNMPSDVTIYAWLNRHQEFLRKYELAIEQRGLVYGEQIVEIADNIPTEIYFRDDAGNVYTIEQVAELTKQERQDLGLLPFGMTSERLTREKLRIDARKWVAARLTPRKYGDRSKLDVGGQADNPVTFTLKMGDDD